MVQPLVVTKDKDSGLVNYKGLNKTQLEDEIRMINEVHLPKENRLSKLEEVAILYNIWKPTNRGKT